MNKIALLITLFIGILSTQMEAQNTASFTASATIIQPIGITTTADLNFAHLDAQRGGSVILSPDDKRISTDGVVLSDEAGVSAATFEVTGEPGVAFSISLPGNEFVLTNGQEDMIIKDFTSSLAGTGTLTNGSSTVKVGATLNVNANQQPGIYRSTGALNVTVNYN